MVPMLAACKPSALQICRVKAATEVLPLVPVTAAMVPGWRGKNFAAAKRQRAARVGDLHEGDVVGQPVRALLGRDRHRAGRRRRAREMRAVGLGAGDGDEQEARLDLAAVGGNAGDLDAPRSAASKRASSSGRSASLHRGSVLRAGQARDRQLAAPAFSAARKLDRQLTGPAVALARIN